MIKYLITIKKEEMTMKDGTTEEADIDNMFMTTAAFFTIEQCEPMKA